MILAYLRDAGEEVGQRSVRSLENGCIRIQDLLAVLWIPLRHIRLYILHKLLEVLRIAAAPRTHSVHLSSDPRHLLLAQFVEALRSQRQRCEVSEGAATVCKKS